jgi:hypothetical protein
MQVHLEPCLQLPPRLPLRLPLTLQKEAGLVSMIELAIFELLAAKEMYMHVESKGGEDEKENSVNITMEVTLENMAPFK